jgi:hypothetical protein
LISPQSSPTTFLKANSIHLNKMNPTQQHEKNRTKSLSLQELQEVRDMSRKLRHVKRQMFLKQVETPSPVDSFRSLIMNLAIEEEAKEAFRSRSNSISSEGTSSRSSSFDNSSVYNNDSFFSIGDLHRDEK